MNDLCPVCRKIRGLGESERSPSEASTGAEAMDSKSQPPPSSNEPSTKDSSRNTRSSTNKRQSSSDSARILLCSIHASMKSKKTSSSAGAPSPSPASEPRSTPAVSLGKSQQTANLHWRMFDNRGYGEVEER